MKPMSVLTDVKQMGTSLPKFLIGDKTGKENAPKPMVFCTIPPLDAADIQRRLA